MYTVGQFLIELKNAYAASKKEASLPYSKENLAIGRLLVKNNYLKKIEENDTRLVAQLLYKNRKPAITHIKLISKPSVRIYIRNSAMAKNLRGAGLTILSTNKGILTGMDARKQQLGGEVICRVY